MDLTGKKFGRPTVIGTGEKPRYVLCQCECGTRKEIRATNLTKQKEPTRSCGCIQREKAVEIGSQNIADNSKCRMETDMRFNTNFGVIETDKPPVNNRSGKKGVYYDVGRGLWEAYINVHGKRIHLGRYKSKEEAVKARERAEKEYFLPLIEEKNNQEDK